MKVKFTIVGEQCGHVRLEKWEKCYWLVDLMAFYLIACACGKIISVINYAL